MTHMELQENVKNQIKLFVLFYLYTIKYIILLK